MNKPAAPKALLNIVIGEWAARTVYAAAKLRIPDLLAGQRRTSADLAAELGAVPEALRRILRYLAGLEVLDGDEQRGFGLTEMGQLLRTEVTGSIRDFVILSGEEWHRSWSQVVHTAQTGGQAFEHVHGTNLFSYLDSNPEASRTFDRAMSGSVKLFNEVPNAYDFSGAGTIVDVGGGNGELLGTILASAEGPRGVVFDRPDVVAAAEAELSARGLTERCTLVGGDFLRSVPAGGDTYVISRTLHNWSDEHCLAILGNCAAVTKPGDRVLVIERVILPDTDPRLSLAQDVLMLLVTGGGRARTKDEHRELMEKSGFALREVHALPQDFSILVAERV
ncbi:methyltransferase [Kutzneria albida]|uniref:Phenazine-specific methyltransferase n=1 Tax=Kutzneria albida DSM 43870 TaxID=1449976 RepID=W5W905_9PSEU|nr:methyltransferase [Kutzneria albida]AHH97215.1 phenazine-specific methyltransferase [Kutzneria albida DSM 43870]